MSLRTLAPTLLLAVAAASAAQPAVPPAPAQGLLTLRASGGLADLALGEAAAFHQSAADAYVEAGVPVPTQRSFPAAPALGLDVLWQTGDRTAFGVGIRHAASSAHSLYGDYAGTLDLVSHVSAVFVESVSVVEFGGGPFRPFVGTRGGTVLASSRTEEVLDLGDLGAGQSWVGGTGTGFSLEAFGGATAWVGQVGVFVQGGYRYARVASLDGEARVDGEVLEAGRLPYGLALSGWSGTAGLSVRLTP